MCLTGNGDVTHREWHPHRECISSSGMHIVYTRCKVKHEFDFSFNVVNNFLEHFDWFKNEDTRECWNFDRSNHKQKAVFSTPFDRE